MQSYFHLRLKDKKKKDLTAIVGKGNLSKSIRIMIDLFLNDKSYQDKIKELL